MTPSGLYIKNSHTCNVAFYVAKPVDIRSSSHRRDRVMGTHIVVPPRVSLDLCALLGVDREGVLDVLSKSPEFIHMSDEKGWLSVIDTTRPAPTSLVTAQEHEASRARVINDDIERQRELHIRRSQGHEDTEDDLRRAVRSGANASRVDEDGSPTIEYASSASTFTGPDPNALEEVSDSMPSARWTRDRLAVWARARGFEAPTTMSKNALLRKIRSL